jgi:ribosomal protein S18 acetylase RimI-like enzyme
MLTIEPTDSWERYKPSWVKCAEHLPWFGTNIPFDYDRREQLGELERDFDEENLFLTASTQDGDVVGVLGITLKGEEGQLRAWEPAVLPDYHDRGVGKALLEEGIREAKRRGVEAIRCRLRYPCDAVESASWHLQIYEGFGFEQIAPLGLHLLAELTQQDTGNAPPVQGLKITGREGLGVEDLVEYMLRAFTSDPEDETYFSWDPLVSTREGARDFFESLLRGERGYSPPELFRIAWIKGDPAGLVGSFVPKWEYRPLYGVIGPVGVFPEYRRRGIAHSLILEVFERLKGRGCEYAFLGTHQNNWAALGLYEGIGFKPSSYLHNFEKKI